MSSREYSDTEVANYNKELEMLFGKKDLRVAFEDNGVYPSAIILDRNAFLRRWGKLWLAIGFVLTGAVISLSIGLNISANRPVQAIGFLLDTEDNITGLQPTNMPTVTDAKVLQTAVEKVKQFHKLSFTDYIEHIVSLEREFTTQEAFDNYQRGLLNSLILQQIKNDRLSSWAEPASAPKILEFDEETMTWHVQMNFTWYMGGGKQTTNGRLYTVDMLIKRVSRQHNIEGIAVDAYFIKAANGEY